MNRKNLMVGGACVALAAAAVAPASPAGHGYVERRRGERGRKDSEGEDVGNLRRDIKGLTADLAQRDEQIKAAVKAANDEIAGCKEISEATKATLNEMVEKGTEVQARLTELEQRAKDFLANDNDRKESQLSLGELVAKSKPFVDMFAKGNAFRGNAQVHLKDVATVTSATTDADGSAGDLIVPMRLREIIAPEDRPMTIRRLILPGRTSSSSVEFVRETGFTNAAAPVAENTEKPQSTIKFALDSVPVRTLAHWLLATKQILADAPMLASYIDGRLRYGLTYVEEQQLLLGDGTDQNLLGLIPQSTAFDNSRSLVGDTRLDTLRRSMTQVRLAEYRASGFVLNPEDWEAIELTKDETGSYIFANPQNLAGPRLWGLPVVDTQAMPVGEFLTGAFNMAAQLFDREDTIVEVSTEDRDNFIKNLVTIRAEERLALAVFREEALVHGGFDGPTGSP